MKKRIIALFLAVAVLASMLISVNAQETSAIYTDAEELFAGFGIIDTATYEPDNKLTRGEFATLISKFILFGQNNADKDWYDKFFGVEPIGDSILPDAPLFNDVDASHSEFVGIRTVVNAGYMNGISPEKFAPDFQITLAETTKVIVSMLGYKGIAEAQGGYPVGYTQTANKLKLYTGLSIGSTDVVTNREILGLIYNALDIELKEVTAISDEGVKYSNNGETFLNFYLNLAKAEGTMTDNGITTLTSASSKAGTKRMVVGGKTLKYTDNALAYTRHIGREVIAYYSISEGTRDEVIYIQTQDSADVITEGTIYKNGVLHYTINGRDDSTKIPRSATVIYNGVYTDTYTDDMLTVNDGTVTLIDGEDGLIVVVRKYKDIVVSNVSYKTSTVYNTLKFYSLSDGKAVISLEEGADYECILVLDEYGNTISAEDIVKGDVLSIVESKDGKTYLEVTKVPSSVAEANLTSYNSEEFITDSATYEYSDSYNKATNKEKLNPGETYKIYLNAQNRIVWVSSQAVGSNKVAIYTGTDAEAGDAFSDNFAVRLFTEGKELKVFNLNEKVTVNGERVKASEVYDLLDSFMGKAVLYESEEAENDNENDTLVSITTPASFGETEVKDWYHVSPALDVFDRGYGVAPFSTQYYEPGDGASFGGNFAYNSSTRLVFTVPTNEEDFDDEKKFLINNPLSSSTSYTVEAYSSIKNDPVPEVLIIYSDAKGSGTIKRNRGLLITKVVQTVDEEGENITAFKGYEIMQNSLKEVTVPVLEDVIMTKVKENYSVTLEPIDPAVDTDVAKYGPLSYTDLEPGDIIRYGTDSQNRINVIRIAFDYSQMKGYDEALHVAWASFAGPVLNVNSKGLKLTYGINPEDIDYTNATDIKKIKGFAFGGSRYPLVFVEKDDRGLSFREGTYEDITSYEMTGSSDTCDFACILTHFTGGRMGGVIYVK